jgi:DNA polymerase-3 subunit epsilon
MSVDFVVVDFETTGILPKNDRIIEIGAIRTSESGKVLGGFTTLINPHRDVGPTNIHGITPGMLRDAPSFGEVLNEFAKILDGAILVAHNALFDARFLDAELERLNHGRNDIDALCTMELMGLRYPRTVRRLVDCCSYLKLPILDAHSAFDDAQMASNLFHTLIKDVSDLDMPEPLEIGSTSLVQRAELKRDLFVSRTISTEDYVSSLLARSKPGEAVISSDSNECQYLNILDQALLDRKLTIEEANDLSEFAKMVRISKNQVSALHDLYVSHLYLQAMEDGVLTVDEENDLNHIADLLNVRDWKQFVSSTTADTDLLVFEKLEIKLSPGMSICFTGAMSRSRDELESIARNHGLLIKPGVSRVLDVLVVADADSMSVKAQKARDMGVPIVAEQVFLSLIQAMG